MIYKFNKIKTTTLKQNIMQKITNEFAKDLHDKLRNILIDNNNPEYGDCIIDEITNLFGYPDTIAVDPEEGIAPEKHNISYANTIESAKQFLKDNGYFVDNLWSVHDVKGKFECTDEQAQTVLNDVLSGEWFTGEVNASIDISADAYNLTKRVSKYFSVSGFWKDDKVKFSNYIVKEFDEVDDEEDTEIFFYGLSASDIEELIIEKWNSEHEFVITSYEETILN